jgi:hypothetical protein
LSSAQRLRQIEARGAVARDVRRRNRSRAIVRRTMMVPVLGFGKVRRDSGEMYSHHTLPR